MANITKISGALYSNITRIGPKLKSSISRLTVKDLFVDPGNQATKQAVFRPGNRDGLDYSNRIIMPTTQEPTSDIRLTDSSTFTINFWVKVGWNSSLDGEGRNIGLFTFGANSTTPGRTDSAYNNTFRLFYDERLNRLYVQFLNYNNSNYYSQNFWVLHSLSSTGLGSTYWSDTNRGNVNSNGFSMLTLTYNGSTSRNNMRLYWNGVDIGNSYYSNGQSNGTLSMNTTSARGINLLGYAFTNAGTFDAVSGRNGGNNTGTYIDEFSIWDKVLTSSEITTLYNSGNGDTISVTKQPTDLIAYWNFDGDSTGISDGEPFSYPIWPDPSTNSNLGKMELDGSSIFVSGNSEVINS